ERRKKLPHLFNFAVKFGVIKGEVFATSYNFEAISIWLPSDKNEMTLSDQIRCGGISIIPKIGLKFIFKQEPVFQFVHAIHDQHAPFDHLYFNALGVRPEHQKKAHGSTLMNTILNKSEKLNLPIYLETNNKRNVSLYEKFGFEVVDGSIIPQTDIWNWGMLRNPKISGI
ncbi:unnamed protein product, partial [marine sediment metagenome]